MPSIANASALSEKVPFRERWLGFISHKQKTSIKNTVKLEEYGETVISNDLKIFKKIVCVFKQGNINAQMPKRASLIQEVEKRFATTFAVIDCVLRSYTHVRNVIDDTDNDAVLIDFLSLHEDPSMDGEGQFSCT